MKHIALVIAIVLSFCAAASDVFCWKVSDGDTIWVADDSGKRKVRMVDIDAPEMNQPYGVQAADRLAELVLGKYVTLKSSGTDQYGRGLETVFIGETDINLQLVKEGLAWRYYTCKDKAYAAAEKDAKSAKRGLWKDATPVNPYQWRKEKHPAAPDKDYNSRKVAIPKVFKKDQ